MRTTSKRGGLFHSLRLSFCHIRAPSCLVCGGTSGCLFSITADSSIIFTTKFLRCKSGASYISECSKFLAKRYSCCIQDGESEIIVQAHFCHSVPVGHDEQQFVDRSIMWF